MAAQDCWSHQERSIASLFECSFITGSGTISEGDLLAFSAQGTGAYGLHGQNTNGVIYMEGNTELGGASGIAMKAGSDGDPIPVMFHGIHKLLVGGSAGDAATKISAGSFVVNSSSKTKITSVTKAMGNTTGLAVLPFLNGLSHILGMAMQIGNGADEILVLVGRSL